MNNALLKKMSKIKKKILVLNFERNQRIKRLIDEGIICSADEIPENAIPVSTDTLHFRRHSYSLGKRPPYYENIEFSCEKCGIESVFTAQE